MCGFVGLFAPSSRRPIDPSELEVMVRVIAHRGPDDEAVHAEPGVALGFRRLSIVDLDGGRQPLENEDGSVWLVFNGEIYNHLELRRELEACGHVFRTRSDSEVIVHAYEAWGRRCAAKLRGIFAFAIWDRTRRTLLLARDHSGVKPLYLARVGGEVLFASEAKAILASGRIPRRLDLMGLFQLHQHGAALERSPFAGIQQLGAGHTLVIGESGESAEPYWSYQPSRSMAVVDTASLVADFRDLLHDVVGMQLMADVPVGAYLSGGLDSSAVVASAVRHGYRDICTYTTASRDFDDEHFSRMLVDRLGLRGTFVGLTEPANLAEVVRHVGWMAEGLFDLGFVTRFQLSRAVREDGIKVLLTGQGIDEILTGYFPETREHLRSVRHGALWGRASVWRVAPVLSDRESQSLLAEREGEDADARLASRDLARMHASLAGHLLRFEDRMGMANGVEVRVPLLDHHLLELAASIPHPARCQLFSGKRILREAVREWLPPEIVDRPKATGFNSSLTPLSRLALARRCDPLDQLLAQSDVERRGYFDWKYCEGRIAANDYLALDAIFMVQLLDEIFITSFDPTRDASPVALEPRRIARPAEIASPGVGAESGSPAFGPDDVPVLHVDVVGFLVPVESGVASRVLGDAVRALFAQGWLRGPTTFFLDLDLVQVLCMVDGVRTCAEIHRELQNSAEIDLETLLGALSDLRQRGALGDSPRFARADRDS